MLVSHIFILCDLLWTSHLHTKDSSEDKIPDLWDFIGSPHVRNQRQFDQLAEDARLFQGRSMAERKEKTQQLRQLEQEKLGATVSND